VPFWDASGGKIQASRQRFASRSKCSVSVGF
jgi:hypothetical protein